ncbi:hypothetical protein V8C86DRAFT_2769270 [Haematococcus lacustris]
MGSAAASAFLVVGLGSAAASAFLVVGLEAVAAAAGEGSSAARKGLGKVVRGDLGRFLHAQRRMTGCLDMPSSPALEVR